ncbi:MAG TPA: sigma-70 family RNA polymerase sigma factor [Kofleriaceae bacterium]|jgi:RNA polymerase sigma-70 factor (ECF subfamily)|nr:sigma-70 family RNA polymerase sigma factor [Kofleriaceae bacterium]
MEDGDLVAGAAAVPRNASPGAAAVAASRSAAPDAPAATRGAIPDAVNAAGVVDPQAAPAASTSAGDRRAAIVELMRAHGDAVLGFCIRVLRDRELAEEVRQQTFLEAFRDFDRFRDRSSRRAWLFGIASHRCLDVVRKRRPGWIESDDDALINSHDPGSGPREQLEHAQLTAALEECMQALPHEVRMTVLLRFQTELTYEQLAVQLATRAEALQMRVTRALSKLRRCLESKGAHDA